MILIGPGSLYTSILPNLLVPDLAQALYHAKAPKVYICNLATQAGETSGYDVADHVAAIHQHVPELRLDVVLANDNFSPSAEELGQTSLVNWLILMTRSLDHGRSHGYGTAVAARQRESWRQQSWTCCHRRYRRQM